MQANSVILSGFTETYNTLKKFGAEINKKVIRKAMSVGPKPLLTAAAANARLHKNKKRKSGKHLYQSIGKRLKTYSKDGFIFVAAGGLYRQGGYHAHLLEFGHRIANRGTLKRENGGRTPKSKIEGMTGKGEELRHKKSGTNMVPGYPFMKPAWDRTKDRVLYAITEDIKQNLVDQCVAVARQNGAIK